MPTSADLIAVIDAQNRAIDCVMAILLMREAELQRSGLLKREDMFMPSKSGHIWDAMVQGHLAMAQLSTTGPHH